MPNAVASSSIQDDYRYRQFFNDAFNFIVGVEYGRRKPLFIKPVEFAENYAIDRIAGFTQASPAEYFHDKEEEYLEIMAHIMNDHM